VKRALAPLALHAAFAFGACGSPVEQADDSHVVLSADSVDLAVGTSTAVAVLNTSAPALFASRDETVARVSPQGSIAGIAVGATYVVATLTTNADARDSVRVRVSPFVPDTCAVARPDFGPAATAAELSEFAYDATAPLNLQKTVEISNSILTLFRITYTSPAGGTVPGIMAEPVGRAGLRPGLVLMHPSGNASSPKGVDMELGNAQIYAAHGAVVIAIDAPYFRRNGFGLLFSEQDRLEQVQLMKDLRRAVDVLLARGDVDAARIGFIGYSYGAMMGAQFVGVENRLKAAVLAAAPGGQVTHATSPANISYLANVLSCGTRNAWLRAMTPIESIRFIPNASSELLFQAGWFDTTVLLADAQALYAVAPHPKEIRLYETGHSLNQQALNERHDWLHLKIGLDARQ
jgi:predicted esterase